MLPANIRLEWDFLSQQTKASLDPRYLHLRQTNFTWCLDRDLTGKMPAVVQFISGKFLPFQLGELISDSGELDFAFEACSLTTTGGIKGNSILNQSLSKVSAYLQVQFLT